ncbi:MAG: preprotein translocase subunit YajC [Prevotella sp.]|nr:preprotein translocase subunit YajC [Prevotella sp.]
MILTTLLAAQQAGQQQGGSWTFLIMMVVIFAIMWLFMIKPQQKKQKEIRKFQNSLQEGKKVVVGGGIYGTVKRVDTEKNAIDVEIARGVTISVDRNYVFADASDQAQTQSK